MASPLASVLWSWFSARSVLIGIERGWLGPVYLGMSCKQDRPQSASHEQGGWVEAWQMWPEEWPPGADARVLGRGLKGMLTRDGGQSASVTFLTLLLQLPLNGGGAPPGRKDYDWGDPGGEGRFGNEKAPEYSQQTEQFLSQQAESWAQGPCPDAQSLDL